MTQAIYDADVIVFGCGNILFGNDGFGPAVAKELNQQKMPGKNCIAVDIGTSIRDYLFDFLLADTRPELIIIVDAVTMDCIKAGKKKNVAEGDLFELDISQIPAPKSSVFSLHQSPSGNLLSQLADTGIQIRVLGMHTGPIPNTISPGLSPQVQTAIPKAAGRIRQWIKNREKRSKIC